ncbi:hypothetical protein ACWDA3_47315 [Nonomuraea rubra]
MTAKMYWRCPFEERFSRTRRRIRTRMERTAAGRLSFRRVGMTTLADALPLPVQAAYLHREVPAAVIVVYWQTRTRHADVPFPHPHSRIVC